MANRPANTIQISLDAALWGGFAMLLAELRFEHRGVLLGDFRPWIPLGYCACMLIIIPFCALLRERGGRRLLRLAYGLSILVGMAGLLFHSDGHMLARLADLSRVWTLDLHQSASLKAHYPPPLAPSAFIGLGIIGIIYCLGGGRPAQEESASAQPALKEFALSKTSLEQSGACCAPEGE